MESNLIEHMRKLFCEIQNDKRSIRNDLSKSEDKHKKQIIQRHRIRLKNKNISRNQKTLLNFYDEKNGALAEAEKQISSKNNLGVFYSNLTEILAQKKNLNEPVKTSDENNETDILSELNFSGEEFYGKYVEMNENYQEFLNIRGMPSMYLNGIKKIDYKLYLEIFDHFHNISQKAKMSKKYFRYCQHVLEYLRDFYSRKYPLYPIDLIVKEIREDFEEKWAMKSISGWQKEWPIETFQKNPIKSTVSLKEKALMQRIDKKESEKPETGKANIHCQVCNKDFKESVYKSHITGRSHKKREAASMTTTMSQDSTAETKTENPEKVQSENDIQLRKKETAFFEFAIKTFKTLLFEVFEETIYYIEKKLTRSYEENLKEMTQREVEDVEGEEEEIDDGFETNDKSLYNGGVYNPKKVPLGWDGKPIPYWLYKFHGLNIAYKCEICGGTNYYGPRAFQQHFKEWKHAHGMKALGLPNTKHFHNVTKIDEAEQLYRKLKEKRIFENNAELEEEFEDNEGNVYGRQTYEALKRQRVI